MKKIFTMAAIAAATVLSASCAKEEESGLQKKGITAHASLQPVEATKASGQHSYNIVWDKGDKISVLDNAKVKATFVLTEGEGTTTGTFQQEGTDALTAPLTAYYPASVVAEDKSLVWPATQADVKSISNVPMTASSPTATGDVNFAFKHLGSVLQLVLTAKNGEIDVKQIDITADQGLSGAFTVENGTAKINSTGTTISTGDISDKNIKLSATASYLNFAVPSGSFTNFKITITDTNDKEYSLSAASLTLNRAMVGKVTFALDAKDPAVFVLNVNGHTVRIVHSSDEGIPDDVWIKKAEVVDSSIKVTALSISGKHLKCFMPDGKFCTSQSKTENLVYTFTISDITENTTATIGYAEKVSNIGVTPDGAGSVKITGDAYEGETVTLTAIPAYEYGFDAWLDKDSNPLVYEEEIYPNVRLSSDGISVRFKKNLILGGEFSVADGKKVRFTRGNLYYDSSSNMIEQHQYDFNSYQWTHTHVSHFMWCDNIYDAASQKYYDDFSSQNLFFTENNFTVSGFSMNQCHPLTTEEWQYLFGENDARKGKYKLGVKICEQNNCVVLLPDDWVGDTIEYSYDYVEWKHMEAAGAVCLPAAGSRYGYGGGTLIDDVGSCGCYWSANPYGFPYGLKFGSSSVSSDNLCDPAYAFSVRLVTEVK